jgi:phage-related protein
MTVPQSIQEQIQSLEPSAIIELFQLQLTAAVNGVDTTFYYHAGTNELSQDIVFNSRLPMRRIRLKPRDLS